MDDAPGWQQDPEREDQERYWSGSGWTDRVRPAGNAGSPRLPEHVPELHRALAAATADIEVVEDRLSTLFDRAEGAPRPRSSPVTTPPPQRHPDDDEIIELVEEEPIHEEFDASSGQDDDTDENGAFAELDAALAAEEPEESKRGFFRRRSTRPPG
jgi:hypothetical protein